MASGEPESSEEPGSSKRLGDSEGQKARKEEEDSEKPVESTNVAKSRDSQDATRSNRKSYIEMRDNGGRSALYFAARNNCQSVVTTLLEAKATITTEDLNIAAEKGHEDVVRQFLEKLASDKMLISKFSCEDFFPARAPRPSRQPVPSKVRGTPSPPMRHPLNALSTN